MAIIPNPTNPESSTINDVTALINNIISTAFLLAGGIAVIYIIVGAYYYFTAYGKEDQATKGKTTITWAIVGLIIIILARVIEDEIWRFFAK